MVGEVLLDLVTHLSRKEMLKRSILRVPGSSWKGRVQGSSCLLEFTPMPPPHRKPGTLSNGTLSLKFMQRALIAENKTPVEAEKAETLDDSKWFIDSAAQQTTLAESQSLYVFII
jgi:hypothetical protein